MRITNGSHIRPRRNAAAMAAVKMNDKINTEHEVPNIEWMSAENIPENWFVSVKNIPEIWFVRRRTPFNFCAVLESW